MTKPPKVVVVPPGVEYLDACPVTLVQPGDDWETDQDTTRIMWVSPPIYDESVGKEMVSFDGVITRGWGKGRKVRRWSFPVEQTLPVVRGRK